MLCLDTMEGACLVHVTVVGCPKTRNGRPSNRKLSLHESPFPFAQAKFGPNGQKTANPKSNIAELSVMSSLSSFQNWDNQGRRESRRNRSESIRPVLGLLGRGGIAHLQPVRPNWSLFHATVPCGDEQALGYI